jgi:hypothetical protein
MLDKSKISDPLGRDIEGGLRRLEIFGWRSGSLRSKSDSVQ